MKINKISNFWNVILNIFLTFLFSLTFLFNKNEIISTIIILCLIAIVFLIKYYKREWILLIVGILTGILLEIGSDQIYKLQYWENGSLFGIPLWLPLFWGYAFILIHRIGRIIVK